jgi:hypothetical protein
MQFSKYISLIFLLFLLSFSAFPQTEPPIDYSILTIPERRAAMIKTDIIREIEGLERQKQARYYVRLANVLQKTNQKEANIWLVKGVEIALSLATDYVNDDARITDLRNALYYIENKDVILANKLVSKIKELLLKKAKTNNIDNHGRIYLYLADQIIAKDEPLAFKFVKIALKDRNLELNWQDCRIIAGIAKKNKDFGEFLLNNLLQKVKTEENRKLALSLKTIIYTDFIDDNDNANIYRKQVFSDAVQKTFLELLLIFIQKDSLELVTKKRNDCGSILGFGMNSLKEYKRLLPEKSSVVEEAINICQNSEVESWKKPAFAKRSRKTSQDYLDLAKEIGDKQLKSNYLQTASNLARNEKNFPLAINIMDSIDKEFRKDNWIYFKIQLLSDYVQYLVKKENFDEITKAINDAPQDYRPYIIIQSVGSIFIYKPKQQQFALDLMNQARADFNKIDKFLEEMTYFKPNPTEFGNLVPYYVKLGLYEDAIATHEESIKSLNRLMANLPPEMKRKPIYRMASYSRFTNQYPPVDSEFFYRYFDQIYRNIGLINDKEIRLGELLEILAKNSEKPQNYYFISGIPSRIPSTSNQPNL